MGMEEVPPSHWWRFVGHTLERFWKIEADLLLWALTSAHLYLPNESAPEYRYINIMLDTVQCSYADSIFKLLIGSVVKVPASQVRGWSWNATMPDI